MKSKSLHLYLLLVPKNWRNNFKKKIWNFKRNLV